VIALNQKKPKAMAKESKIEGSAFGFFSLPKTHGQYFLKSVMFQTKYKTEITRKKNSRLSEEDRLSMKLSTSLLPIDAQFCQLEALIIGN
jgi:hypothetical protein